MKKLVVFGLCIALFGLLYTGLVATPTPGDTPRVTTTDSDPPPSQDTTFALKLDRTLGSSPNAAVPVQRAPFSDYVTPTNLRLLGILLATLALGWLTARASAPQYTERHRSTTESPHSHTTAPALDTLTASDTPTQQAVDDALQSLREQHDEQNQSMQLRLASQETELTDAHERLSTLDSTLNDLRGELEEMDAQRQQLDASLIDQQAKRNEESVYIQQLEHDNASLQETIDTLQHDLAQSTDAILARDEQIGTLNEDIETVRTSLDTQTQQADQDRHALRADLDALHAQFESQNECYLELEQDNASWQSRHNELLDALSAAEKQRDELVPIKAAHAELHRRFDTLVNEFEQTLERATDADTLDEQVATLERELAQRRAEHDALSDHLATARSQIETLEARAVEADTLEEALGHLKLDFATMSSERDALDEQQMALSAELQSAKSSLDARAQHVETLGEQLAETKKSAETLSADLASTRDELDQSNTSLSATQLALDEKTEALNALNEAHDALTFQSRALSDALDQQKQETIDLQSDNEALSESIGVLREDLSDLVQQQGERNSENEQLKRQIIDEQKLSSAKQSELDVVSEALDTEHTQNESLHHRLDQQREETQQVEQKLAAWDNSLSTYRDDIAAKNRALDSLHDTIREREQSIRELTEQREALAGQLAEYGEMRQGLESAAAAQVDLDAELTKQNETLALMTSQLTAHADAIVEQDKLLEQADTDRQMWLDEMTRQSRVIDRLETELLEQHELTQAFEELIDGALVHREMLNAPPHAANHASNADEESPVAPTPDDQPTSSLLNKGQRLLHALDTANRSNSTLTTTLEATKREVRDAEKLVGDLQRAGDQQADMFAYKERLLHDRLNTATQEKEALESEVLTLKDAREAAAEEVAEYAAQIDQLQRSHHEEIERTEHTLQSRLDATQQEHERALREQEAQLDGARQAELNVLIAAKNEAENSLRATTLDLASRDDELLTLGADKDTLLEELGTLKDASARHTQTLTTQLRELQSDVDAWRAEADSAKEWASTLADEVERKAQAVVTADQRVAQIEQHKLDLDTALAASETSKKQLEYEVEELKELMTTVDETDRNIRQAHNELQDELATKTAELTALRLAEERRRSNEASLTTELDDTRTRLETLSLQFADAETTFTQALQSQQQRNQDLRDALAKQKEALASTGVIPVLSTTVTPRASRRDIPTLGKPVQTGSRDKHATRKDDIPVLKQPVSTEES